MRATTAAAIINSVMWLAVSAAVIYAIDKTGRLSTLWVFLIPALSSVTVSSRRKTEDDDDE